MRLRKQGGGRAISLQKIRKADALKHSTPAKKPRQAPAKTPTNFYAPSSVARGEGLMNADHLVIRMFVDTGQYEARIFVAVGWIESSLRCLCCRLVEVLGPSERSWYEGIDAQVRHLAVWKVVGGHQQSEAIPEVGTPRIFLRNDTKLALPCFLCDSNAVAVDV